MKIFKKILTIAFLTFTLISFGQDNTRMDKISEIANKAIANCEGEKYGADDQETKKNLSLYGEYYKQKAYADALPYWRYVIFNAPKSSVNLYIRGAKMYKALAKASEGEVRESYRDTLYALFEIRLHCYGSTAKLEKSKAFAWYNYRKKGNEKFVLDLFTKTYDAYVKEGTVPPAGFLTYWVDVAIRSDKTAKAISSERVLEIYGIASDIIDEQLSGEKAGEYKGSQNKITEKMDKMGYLECDVIVPMTEKRFRANPDDVNTIKKSYKALKSGSCTDTPLFIEVATKMLEVQPSAALYKFLASKEKKAGNTSLAIEYLNSAKDLTEDQEGKIKILLQIGGMYYKSGSKSKARSYANKVLALNPNSGKAYILIGRTLAGACGSGIEKQATYWAAVDKWQRAKSVDGSVSAEAQKLINTYSGSFPGTKDLFMHGLTAGSSYKIACLGITTTVRASN